MALESHSENRNSISVFLALPGVTSWSHDQAMGGPVLVGVGMSFERKTKGGSKAAFQVRE